MVYGLQLPPASAWPLRCGSPLPGREAVTISVALRGWQAPRSAGAEEYADAYLEAAGIPDEETSPDGSDGRTDALNTS
jgi:hypothetical protein